MLKVLALSAALTLSAAPAHAAVTDAVPEGVDPETVEVVQLEAPTQCADADLSILADPLVAAIGDPIAPDYCFEDCDAHPDVDCTGDVCSAVNRNCSVGERGYVTCDGNTTFCPPCPGEPECDSGDFRIVRTGQCCDCNTGGEVTHFQECVDEQWVTNSTDCGPSSSCPLCP